MKKIKIYIIILLTIIVTYLLTYIDKIGLHGDEALLGLDGIQILKVGISKPYGMNKYTGILQAFMNSLSFKIFGINVNSLRITGVISNIISLFILIKILKNRIGVKAILIFLLLFAQSIFLLCYSKIAWEVCSFNFLFIATSLFSIHKIEQNKQKNNWFYVFMFLFLTLLGSYNHILFSNILVTLFFSIFFYVWFNKVNQSDFLLKLFSITIISLFNITCLFVFMELFVDIVWNKIGFLIFISPFILIILEIIIFKKILSLISLLFNFLNQKSLPNKILKNIIIFIPILLFLKFHFFNFFDVLGNNIIIMRLFSYSPNYILKWYFMLVSGIIVSLTTYFLVTDFIKKTTTIWSYFIIFYLGIFCLYTIGSSIRYYHILTIFLFLFLSSHLLILQQKFKFEFITVIMINLILVQIILWNNNLDQNRKVNAMIFKIGLKNTETSAHFLNFSKVIDYVRKNNIGEIKTTETFFIGNVFSFYRNVYPEIKTYNNSAYINYNYKDKGSGFKTAFIENKKSI